MKYDVISADGHVDLIWLPPDLFTAMPPPPSRSACPMWSRDRRGPNG